MISRFSEDIDITVFCEDIGQAATVEELEALTGKKRAVRLDAIRKACQNYINGPLREQLSRLLRALLESANLAPEAGRIEPDPDDPDQQSLLLWYPTVLEVPNFVTVEPNPHILGQGIRTQCVPSPPS